MVYCIHSTMLQRCKTDFQKEPPDSDARIYMCLESFLAEGLLGFLMQTFWRRGVHDRL